MIASGLNHLMELKHVSPFHVQWHCSFNAKTDKNSAQKKSKMKRILFAACIKNLTKKIAQKSSQTKQKKKLWETSCLKVPWDCEISMNCQTDFKTENRRLMNVLGANDDDVIGHLSLTAIVHHKSNLRLKHDFFREKFLVDFFSFLINLFGLVSSTLPTVRWCDSFVFFCSKRHDQQRFLFRVPHVICKKKSAWGEENINCVRFSVSFFYFEPIIHCGLVASVFGCWLLTLRCPSRDR